MATPGLARAAIAGSPRPGSPRRGRIRAPWGTTLLLTSALLGSGCDTKRDEHTEMDGAGDPSEGQGLLGQETALGPGRVGDTLVLIGQVSGAPVAEEGFFVETGWGRQLFVASSEAPPQGAAVRILGVLEAIDVGEADDWEVEAFGGQSPGSVERLYYLKAARIDSLPETPRIDAAGS